MFVWCALACCRFWQEVRVWRRSRDFSLLVVSASCQIVRCQCFVSFWTEACGVARHGMSFRCVTRFCWKLVRHVASFEGNSVVRLVEGFLREVCCVHMWFQFFQRVSIAGSRLVFFIYFSGGPLQMPKCPFQSIGHLSQSFCEKSAPVDNYTIVYNSGTFFFSSFFARFVLICLLTVLTDAKAMSIL